MSDGITMLAAKAVDDLNRLFDEINEIVTDESEGRINAVRVADRLEEVRDKWAEYLQPDD